MDWQEGMVSKWFEHFSFIFHFIPISTSQVVLVVTYVPTNAGDVRDVGSIPGGEDPLEKEMATQSGILVWEIPWTQEPGRLQSMGLQRVGHKWSNLAHLALFLLL